MDHDFASFVHKYSYRSDIHGGEKTKITLKDYRFIFNCFTGFLTVSNEYYTASTFYMDGVFKMTRNEAEIS